MSIHDFNEIRPYSGDEIKEAIKRIVEAPELEAVANFLLPGEDLEKLKEGIRSSKTKHEFQINLMDKVMRAIAARYTDGITSEGIEDLKTGEASLFLANHRDIILDSSFLAMLMLEKGYKTSEMTWGDNLMVTPFIVDVGKVNGMITVFRDGTPRELLKNSQRLSAYIRNAIVERKESVWIAHHKGRAKDGNDKTDVSVIKMLLLSGENSPKEKLLELNIRTVTISYEWEPCDARKVNELYHSKNKVYVKDKMEDLESIIGGVLAPKGRVHLVMSKPLTDKIKEVPGNLNTNETAAKVAEIVDLQINRDYKLWPSNYLAYDILNKSSRFAVKYGDDVKTDWKSVIRTLLNLLELIIGRLETFS